MKVNFYEQVDDKLLKFAVIISLFADIYSFENELHSEMESISFFNDLPTEWTYPLIQPLLIKEYLRRTNAK